MIKSILIVATAFALVACSGKGERFTIEGTITEATDTMLVLEHLRMDGAPEPLDSVRLGEQGTFAFRRKGVSSPEFFRLRIGAQIINLSVDSTETISVRASLPTMSEAYEVAGSGNCDTIRLLTLELRDLARSLRTTADDRTLTLDQRQASIAEQVGQYKQRVKLTYIQNRYDKASSYFAMFQTVGGMMVFDPTGDASDVTWFSALANAWELRWPDAPRTENLRNIALRGHKLTRRKVLEVSLDDEKVSETGIIDMTYTDRNGHPHQLSALRDQVVVLDFTAYSLPGTQERLLALRELYAKYHDRGLEIYQVGLDADEHYWKTMTRQLPWPCVLNREGAQNDIVSIYNLQQLPTWFVIDRNLDLVGRQEFLGPLEDEIRKLL